MKAKSRPALTAVANHIANDLFTTSFPVKISRLVMVDENGKEVAGWGVIPLRDRVLDVLQKHFDGRRKR